MAIPPTPAAEERERWKYAALKVSVGLVVLVLLGLVGVSFNAALDETRAPVTKLASQLLFRGGDGVGALSGSPPSAAPVAKRKATTKTKGKRGTKKKKGKKKGAGSGSKGVDLSEYALTRELVDRYAKDDFIAVSFGNLAYLGFIENWVKHLQDLGVENYVVGAMDDDCLRALIESGTNVFSMSHSFPGQDFGWGSKLFYKMARAKIRLIRQLLEMNMNVMVSDVDTVWLQDPNRYHLEHEHLDIMTSSDALRTTSQDGIALEDANIAREAYNIGILYFRSTNATREFLSEWVRVIEQDEKYWDQNAFNDLLRRDFRLGDDMHHFSSYGGRVKVGVLPVSSFCNGHTFFVQRMPETLKIDPYVVHATFQYAGTEGKRHRFRERKLWYDHPEYYTPEGGILTYDPDLPQELLDRGAYFGRKLDLPGTRGHFDLVNHQLRQLRQAFGVARALGRTLVMPKLVCGNDRWWAPHNGVIPGSSFQRPFACPLDHVIDVNVLVAAKYVDFREYSFLENERTPNSAKQNKAVVSVCDGGDAECGAGGLTVGPGTDSRGIRERLGSVPRTTRLHFTSMLDAFSGFSDASEDEEFRRFLNRIAGIWCCVAAPTGHIWYDLQWDVVPHVDKHNRRWDGEWEMKLGP